MRVQGNSQFRFLLVESKSSVRTLVKQLLDNIGVTQIDEVNDGKEAWDYLNAVAEAAPAHIIISDWVMEGLDGLELLRLCRKEPAYQNVGFMLLTAEADMDLVKEAVASGVDGYIVKPFSPETFTEKISAILLKYRKRTQR